MKQITANIMHIYVDTRSDNWMNECFQKFLADNEKLLPSGIVSLRFR